MIILNMMVSFKEYLKTKYNKHGEESEKYHTPLSHNGPGSLGLHFYWKHGCEIQTYSLAQVGFLSKSDLITAKLIMYAF